MCVTGWLVCVPCQACGPSMCTWVAALLLFGNNATGDCIVGNLAALLMLERQSVNCSRLRLFLLCSAARLSVVTAAAACLGNQLLQFHTPCCAIPTLPSGGGQSWHANIAQQGGLHDLNR
jgi:hypothetical protein